MPTGKEPSFTPRIGCAHCWLLRDESLPHSYLIPSSAPGGR